MVEVVEEMKWEAEELRELGKAEEEKFTRIDWIIMTERNWYSR